MYFLRPFRIPDVPYFCRMNFLEREDTIAALSTAPGLGAIAILRLSGKEALPIAESLFADKKPIPGPNTVALRELVSSSGEVLDEALITVFRSPRSYTGEDTVEFAIHGSVWLQQRLLEELAIRGARLARPGEFSLRAYLNGKLDLSQAEAVNDLIHSETAASHRLAMTQLRGGFAQELGELRQRLIDFAALIELELDFSEEDVEFARRDELLLLLQESMDRIGKLMQSFKEGNAIRNGIPVAIVGRPNAGKSTLLNALLNEERAIVSPIAGTTRDTIEDVISLNGVAFRFIDTAGIRETEDEIEKMGVARSLHKAREASIVIALFDVNTTTAGEMLEDVAKWQDVENSRVLLVGNKCDSAAEELKSSLQGAFEGREGVLISAKSGWNLEALKLALQRMSGLGDRPGASMVVSNARHYEALRRSHESLSLARQGLLAGASGEFVASDLRRALSAMGEITGAVGVEDVLGSVFGRFCIGK